MALFSKRSLEGYYAVDHRNAPGMCDSPDLPPGVRGGMLFESATITCSHCQRVVVINPDRTRERGYCPKCDHYVCDQCEVARVQSGGDCKTFKQVMDDFEISLNKRRASLII